MGDTEISTKVRKATEADSLLVYAIMKRAMQGYIEQTWGKWDERFQAEYHRKHFESSATTIISFDSKDIGCLVVKDYAEYRMLESVHLLPEYQNRGIGGRLIGEVLDKAGRENRVVRLDVLKINRAVGLYKRLKFRIIGETDKHFVMEWAIAVSGEDT